MFIYFTNQCQFDIDDFWHFLPYKDDEGTFVEMSNGGYQLDLDSGKDFSYLSFITWFVDGYLCLSPDRIDFDYGDDHVNVSVIFTDSDWCFTFTFFYDE